MERERTKYNVQQAVQHVLEPMGSDSEMSDLDDEDSDFENESLERELNEKGLEFDGKHK